MEPTDAQSKRIKYLVGAFGKKTVKVYPPDPRTGTLRVELPCAAGIHQWYFNTDGVLVDRLLTQRLFDPPEPTHKPRNAQDN